MKKNIFYLYFNIIIILFSSACGLDTHLKSSNTEKTSSSTEQISSNPYDIIHFDVESAVIARYGSPYLWFVNTNAQNQKDFIVSKTDLSVYDLEDGIPEVMGGVGVAYSTDYNGIADYIVLGLQRLNRNTDNGVWGVDNPAYLVVLNPDGTEYNTGLGDNGLKGIKLRVSNPYRRIFYDKYHNYIYVPGSGSLMSDNLSGGIDRVKLNNDGSFTFDDDANTDGIDDYPLAEGKSITDIIVFSNNVGAYLEYSSWGNTCLKSFNAGLGTLISGDLCEANLGGDGVNIYALETAKLGSNEYLFVSLSVANKDIDGDEINEDGSYIFILDTNFNILKKIVLTSGMNAHDISVIQNTEILRVLMALSSPDFSSGGFKILNCDSGIDNCFIETDNVLNPTISDVAVSSYGDNFYFLERYQRDNITKFNINNVSDGNYTPIWQYSTNE